ncbi:MAG: hypothetical protein ACM34I_01890 [bacterium]
MPYSFDLAMRIHGEGDAPFTPEAHIFVKNYTRDERGLLFITPECENLSELEAEIDRLHEELERIRTRARREFSKT